jgi:hypothetical protein
MELRSNDGGSKMHTHAEGKVRSLANVTVGVILDGVRRVRVRANYFAPQMWVSNAYRKTYVSTW